MPYGLKVRNGGVVRMFLWTIGMSVRNDTNIRFHFEKTSSL